MTTLAGKTALVTGGGRGIGRAICLGLAAMGAQVIVNYVSRPEAAEETVAAIKAAGGTAQAVRFDVASFAEVEKACKEIAAAGGVDILVNNAGITRDGLLLTMKEPDWDAVIATNLKGAFNCTKCVSRPMIKKRWGRIINVTSVIGFAGNAGQANYAAAKAGLVGFTRSVARELASRSVTVNAVAPGYIATEMTSSLPEAVREKILGEIPAGRIGDPEEVAAAVTFLASPAASYITGSVLHVNGGMLMA